MSQLQISQLMVEIGGVALMDCEYIISFMILLLLLVISIKK